MDRHQLEDQIRASLQARADDVQPTPELWERVSARTTRAARWQLAGWVASGAAAVAVVVIGGVVLLGGPRSVEIQPEPDVVDTPTTAEATEDATTDVVPGAATPTLVTTDGETLYRVDATTGEVVQELFPFEGFAEGAEIHEVAVRPVSEEGVVTVAMTIRVEGTYDVEVAAFDADGNRVARRRVGMASPDPAGFAPDVVWSADGRYVMWAGRTFLDGGVTDPGLWTYDWVEAPVDDDGVATPVPALGGDAGRSTIFDADTVDLREWSGPTDGDSRVLATSTDGNAWIIELGPVCDPDVCGQRFGEARIGPFAFEGATPIDIATLDSGVTVALVARSDGSQSAENATFALLAEPMSDQQRELELPRLTEFTAAPFDAWMAVAGDRVVVGFGGTAHLLQVAGDVVEDTATVEVTTLSGSVANAGVAVVVGGVDHTPTDPGATATATEDDTTIGADGLASHVITNPTRDELRLVARRAPDTAVATWTRPAGVPEDAAAVDVVVHPASSPQDLQVVTRWSIGESDTFVLTIVRDGVVVTDDVMDVQPDNLGGAAEIAVPTPVFSADGAWLAWVETPQGGASSAQVRFVPWGAEGPTDGPGATLASDDSTRPIELLDWAIDGDDAVLTLRPAPEPGSDGQVPTAMVELRLPGGDPRAPNPTWRSVDLPGVLFEAGSFQFEDGSERYVAYAGGQDVLYALADAPGTGVPTGAYAFSEGRVASFGPDSALVHTAGTVWQRVQVDDGAATTVSMPDATVAVLPWGSPSAG